jgi:hypothetical protein
MSNKLTEQDWMAYLYGELEGEEKEKVDQYLLANAEARAEFERFRELRGMMAAVKDKEVIAPPIFLGDNRQRFIWNTPYFRVIVSIAASLLLIILVGRAADVRMSVSNGEFKLSFGDSGEKPANNTAQMNPSLTANEVQHMIDASLNKNNSALQANWTESQQKIDASIRKNLALNSGRIDLLVREAATASQDQIRQYVSSIQRENMQVVKDYFQLTSNEQKTYMENLLVDFTEYLQQQRTSDLQLVQTQLNSLQQNTNVFQQETEQILTSLISTVGTQPSTETKN